MPLLVTSASGVNGDGYGPLLAFDRNGAPLGVFCNDERIADPRGLVVHQHEGLLYLNSGQDRVLALDAAGTVVRDTGPIEGLNPGGGNFGPDGRYYVGLRTARTVIAFTRTLHAPGEHFLALGIVPFPRGFAFGRDGRLFLGSGIGPMGEGDNSIIAFAPNNDMQRKRLVSDPELSPLDLAIAPNGNIVVSSEHPFGASDAVTTVREYDAANEGTIHFPDVLNPKQRNIVPDFVGHGICRTLSHKAFDLEQECRASFCPTRHGATYNVDLSDNFTPSKKTFCSSGGARHA